jgi:hypothetical protein
MVTKMEMITNHLETGSEDGKLIRNGNAGEEEGDEKK